MIRQLIGGVVFSLVLGAGAAIANDHTRPKLFGVEDPCPNCYVREGTPALHHEVHSDVVVRRPRRVVRHVPAQYQTVTDHVLVRPARVVNREVPAIVQTHHEHVLVEPARREWQYRRDATGHTVLCEVEVPARYQTIARPVEIAPATVEQVTLPAEYRERHRRVLVTPARRVVAHTAPEVHSLPLPMAYAPATERWIATTHPDYVPQSATRRRL